MVLLHEYESPKIWELKDYVCPLDLAERGRFVQGRVVDMVLNPATGLSSLYRVSWSDDRYRADDSLFNGSCLRRGDDLMSWEEAVPIANEAARRICTGKLRKFNGCFDNLEAERAEALLRAQNVVSLKAVRRNEL